MTVTNPHIPRLVRGMSAAQAVDLAAQKRVEAAGGPDWADEILEYATCVLMLDGSAASATLKRLFTERVTALQERREQAIAEAERRRQLPPLQVFKVWGSGSYR